MRSPIPSSRQDNRRRRFFLRHLTLLSVLLVLIVAAALSAVLAGAKSGERATTAVERRLFVNSVMHPLAVSGTSVAVSPPVVTLGTAENFGVLGGSTVTNTGPTIVQGNLGVSPGSAVTGFPPGIVIGGAIHANDAVAMQAQNDLTTAYNNIAATPCTVDLTGQDLGGLTLTPGIYCFSSSAQLTGALTLDALGNSNARFVFKIGSTLTTANNSSVTVINGGSNCDRVTWQVGSSATLGAGSSFVGDILALTSITLGANASTSGKVLARNGPVTLDANNVNSCSTLVITCPGGITRFTDSGQLTATVNPGAPVATDNVAVQSVTGVRSDGKALNAPYPIGVTTITWTATDTSGNKASCGQSIAVMVPSGERRRP
jgi:Ice-binding-like/HYR domain